MNERLVGSLEYYGPGGMFVEKIDYTDPQEFRNVLQLDLYTGEALTAVVYQYPGEEPVVSEEWFIDRMCNLSAHYRVAKPPIQKKGRRER